MINIYEALEFHHILSSIAPFCESELGKKKILSLRMYGQGYLKDALLFLDELIILNTRYGKLPHLNSQDLSPMLDFAFKGGVLDVYQLEAVSYDVLIVNKLLKSLEKRSDEFTIINKNLQKLTNLNKLEEKIHRVIAPDLTIYDNASKTLQKIRKDIKQKETTLMSQMQKIMQSLSDFLSESIVTIRNGHFVLPLKTNFKNKVKGIIHDISDSGATTFIEPDWAVEINNDLYILKKEEEEEIKRLLSMLTVLVTENAHEILLNNEIIAQFDYTQAKALYALKTNAHVAQFETKKIIDLKKARHPLIDPKKVVGNDFYFDEEHFIIVISGPNAGGKTVALKTLALMVLMNQCGLALPTYEQATLSYFQNIYVDIGDQQSLESNLSTFSSHIHNLSEIASKVTNNDLVILDEIGTGTSPIEGEALAISYLEYLRNKKVFTFSSSHYDGLKTYALNAEGVLNASVLFDEDKMMPTYVLKTNVPGRSYGLEVAEKLSLEKSIIENARTYLSKNHYEQSNEALLQLQKLIFENEMKLQELVKQQKELANKEKQTELLEQKLKSEREVLFLESEKIKAELIAKAKEDIDDIFQKSNERNLKLHEVINLKKELDNLITPKEEEVVKITGEINEGDYVLISSLNVSGRVKQKRGNKLVIVSKEGLTFQTTLQKVLKTVAPKQIKEKDVVTTNIISDAKPELNIIGLYVEEAMELVRKYLDSALTKNLKTVRIIHGFGKGALRQAVHEYLKTCNFVESYELGGQYDGGGGATIIKFK